MAGTPSRLMSRHFDFFFGTFAPALRAWERPMAMACLRLWTFLPDRPLLSVPFFRSCIAFLTFLDAVLPYLAIAAPPLLVRLGRRLWLVHLLDLLFDLGLVEVGRDRLVLIGHQLVHRRPGRFDAVGG